MSGRERIDGLRRAQPILPAAVLCLLAGAAAGEPSFSESFGGAALDPNLWHLPAAESSGGSSYIGRTQFRVARNAALPATDGKVCLPIESFNPTGFSFYGTEIISGSEFAVGPGLDVIVHARMATADSKGIVGGIFLYRLEPGSDTVHDEIDFELLTNVPDKVQTNIYGNEPLGNGHVQMVPYRAGGVGDWHTYEIRWEPGRVSWLIDGEPARTTTDNVPTHPMSLHLNIWAPDHWWPQAYSESIQPVKASEANAVLDSLCVDRVTVRALAADGK